MAWPDIAQYASATIVTLLLLLLFVALLARLKSVRDRLAARRSEVERQLAQKRKDRGARL